MTSLSELLITLWAASVHGYVRSTWLDGLNPWIARTLGEPAGIGSALPTAAVDVLCSTTHASDPELSSKVSAPDRGGFGALGTRQMPDSPEEKR